MAYSIRIGGVDIEPGSDQTVHLPVAPLYTQTAMTMPVRVICGQKNGPRLFVSAAIHGDEINGVEIVRRLLSNRLLKRLRGTLIAVPVVNVFGYTGRNRYLPDRRDLNRSFPGSASGSMAARLAHLFTEEVVANSTHGIDLHTGALHRTNLPHVRVSLEQKPAVEMANAFRVPVIMHANIRDGSLRQAVLEKDIPILLYEAGEALRFDEKAIQAGLRGIISVMRKIGMLPGTKKSREAVEPIVTNRSKWIRAPESGTLGVNKGLGEWVEEGEILGVLNSPLGDVKIPVHSPVSGILIGLTTLPLVYEGEALFNIAAYTDNESAENTLDRFDLNLNRYIDDLPPGEVPPSR